MTVATFGLVEQETALLWRSPVLRNGQPAHPYWSPEAPVIFLLDRRCALSWLMVCPGPGPGLDDSTLAPAPYLGALSTVLSDLLAEEGP